MYVKGIWLSDFTRVVMIPLQKNMNAVECSDHQTISLISYASKILLKILTNRIKDAFNKRKELLTRSIRVDLRKRLVKTHVWPVVLYECDT